MLTLLAQGLVAPLLAAYLITLLAGLALLLASFGRDSGKWHTRIGKNSR
jgi:hypothetical protein